MVDTDSRSDDVAQSRNRLPTPGCMLATTILVILTSACAWIGWRAHRQQVLVTALLRYEASVEARYTPYRYEPPPSVSAGTFRIVLGRGQSVHGFSVVDEPPKHLAWITPVVAEHCFARVAEVSIHDARFSDADVELLLGFPDLRVIDVSDTAITDAGLVKLATLDRLVMLDVYRTKVSDESLRHLVNCRDLRELDIGETDASPEVIAELTEALPDCWIH